MYVNARGQATGAGATVSPEMQGPTVRHIIKQICVIYAYHGIDVCKCMGPGHGCRCHGEARNARPYGEAYYKANLCYICL